MRWLSILWKVGTTLLLLYILYALVGSTLPWLPAIRGKPNNSGSAGTAKKQEFSGTGEGKERVALIEEPKDAYNVRVAMLRAAESSIDIVYYAILDDASGRAFLGEVLKATDRGVTVRILLDGKINAGKGIRQSVQALGNPSKHHLQTVQPCAHAQTMGLARHSA